MKIVPLLSISLLLSFNPAQANECVYLWLERNTIYDEAGYCFKTNLGRAVFDNSDCYTRDPALTSRERNRIAQISRTEKSLGCKRQKKNWTPRYIFQFL